MIQGWTLMLAATLAAGAGAAGSPPDTSRAIAAEGGSAPVAAGPRRLERFPEAAAGVALAAEVPADTPVARVRAIEHSDAYYTRLELHRIGSYAMLPLFGAQYLLGQNLLTSQHPASWERPAHKAVAYGVAGVFTLNTVTGVWNLWDARHEANGRGRRTVHALSMLVADAGFVAVGATAHNARFTSDAANRHRNIALGSMGLSLASGLFMKLTR